MEDRRFRLLAHSAHDGPVDDVRRDTILRRAASPEVIARLERLGVPAAHEPVRLPADPVLDMGARICFPVRTAGRLLGFVWVLDDPRLADDESDALGGSLAEIGRELHGLQHDQDARRAEEQHALEALLADADTGPARRLLAEHGPLLVAVAAPGTELEGLRRTAGSGRALNGEHDGRPVALLVAPRGHLTAEEPLGVGESDALDGAPAAYRDALLALTVILAVPRLGPVARFADLGAYGLLAPLAGAAATLPEPLRRLAAAEDGAELTETLRVVLDAGDDVTGAAATLRVHRSTLHRRLRRVEELTGTGLGDGATRLLLHAGLLLAELRAGSA